MSLISALDIAKSSIRTIQSEIQVVSGNVSNAGVEGYTRKSLNLSADTNGTDGIGGVRINGYNRDISDTVSKLLNQAISDDGLKGTQKDYLNRIQDLLGSTQSSPLLSKALSEFSAAWKTFATSPEDATNKTNIIYKAQNLTYEITREAAGLDKITADANKEVDASVTDLNSSLQRVYDLNNEINAADAAGVSSTDLQDQRDQAVQTISKYLKITVVQRSGNRLAIFTPGGSSLLDNSPNQYVWNGSTITQNGTNVTSQLSGGKLEALIGILDPAPSASTLNDPGKASLYKIEQQLDKLTDLLANPANTFATAYNSATTNAGEEPSAFFSGTTRYTFALNSNIATGATTIKQAAAKPVSDDLNLSTRSISAGNLSTTNVSYTTYANAIIATQNQNAKQVTDNAEISSNQKDTYAKRIKDETGVNVDTEIVKLTELQNNYAASARVISTVKSMYDILDGLFR